VRHEHDRARLARQRTGEPLLHPGAGDRVERPERLVEQEHGAAREQRAHEGHALTHPAGQLGRVGALEPGEAEAREQRRRGLTRLGTRRARAFEREARVGERVAPGQQHVALRHERAAAQPLGRGARDRALVRLLEPGEQLEQRRLAAARRPDDGEHLAVRHAQVEAVERRDRAEAADRAAGLDGRRHV
jgi:hypothetical protein